MKDHQVLSSVTSDTASNREAAPVTENTVQPVHYQHLPFDRTTPGRYEYPPSANAPAPGYGPPPVRPAPPQTPYIPPPPYPAQYAPGQAGYPRYTVYPTYPYPAYRPYYRVPGSGKATASLVLGIISLVFAWMSFLSVVAVVCGAVGLILGSIARRELPPEQSRGAATAGLVCSIIGLVFAVIVLTLSIVFLTRLIGRGLSMGPAYGV